jgi:predicted transposase YbfD/YdcC
VQRERRHATEVQLETAFYISIANDPQTVLNATGQHWAIKNSLHCVLDVTFHEDDARIRTGNSLQNIALLRHLALNILKNDKSKGSLRNQRYKAALNTTFLAQLLRQV